MNGSIRDAEVRIETKRLVIREQQVADLDGYHLWISDSEVMRYVAGFPRTKSREESIASLREAIESSYVRPRRKFFVALELKETGDYIGSGGGMIRRKNDDSGIMGIGYFLIKDYWQKGYATEATGAWINYTFGNLGIHKIEAGCESENKASEQVMLKCGMQREALLREHRYREGRWRDGLRYGILKSEWEIMSR